MHIPDGYLGPQTYVPAYGLMVALWAWASRVLNATLRARQAPMLALGAAFSFVVMMFNVPIPGGTTGHAVGAVLAAILLGPWAALVAVSLALVVQALVFGDGGVTAIGANCLNMAVVMPFTGWAVYRLVVGSAPASSRRHSIGAALGGYVGLNAAAMTTAVMFGIQPLIARAADGRALYNPFGLKIAVPAMAVEHLLVFGVVEAAVTGLVVGYIQRTDPSLIQAKTGGGEAPAQSRLATRLALGLVALVLLSPLGLYLPAKFAAGSAWGEWSAEEIGKLAGFVPRGLERLGSVWHAPLSDYAFPGQESASIGALSAAYVVSGLLGVAIVAAIALLLRRALARKEEDELSSGVDAPSDGV